MVGKVEVDVEMPFLFDVGIVNASDVDVVRAVGDVTVGIFAVYSEAAFVCWPAPA